MKPVGRLADLLTQLKKYYGVAHQQMRDDDAFYYQDESVVGMRKPRLIPTHFPASAANIVDNMREQMPTESPTIDWTPKTRSEESFNRRTLMIRWAEDRLRKMSERTEVAVFDQWKHDLLLRGAACSKVLVNPAEVPDKPVRGAFRRKAAYDQAVTEWTEEVASNDYFIVRAIDPLSVYPSPGSNRPLLYMLEVQQRTVSEVLSKYDRFTDPVGVKLRAAGQGFKADDLMRPVEWLEFWSEEWYVIEVDGERVVEVKNPYGMVPYIFEYSGLGREHADGDPKYLARGLLTGIHNELRAEVRAMTAWDAQWQFHVFPLLLVKNNARLAAMMLQKGPGGVAEWGRLGNEPPTWLPVPPPNAEMVNFLSKVQGGMSRQQAAALANPASSQSQYGILEAMKISQALKLIAPVASTLNKMASSLVNTFARMSHYMELHYDVSSSDTRVSRLSPEDFIRYTFVVQFERIEAAENDRRLLVGTSLYDKGLISRRTFHREYGKNVVEDPDEEDEQILTERILQQMLESGVFLQAVMQGVTAEAAVATAEENASRVAEITGAAGEMGVEGAGPIAPQTAARTAGRQVMGEVPSV